MNLTKSLRLVLLALAAVVVMMAGGFALSRALAGDRVLGAVSALGVELDGMTRTEVESALASAEVGLQGRPVTFEIRGAEAALQPAQVGFEVDIDRTADRVLEVGRRGDVSEQFRWWLSHIGRRETVSADVSVEEPLIEAVLETWDQEYIGNPPVPGSIDLDGATPVPSYPKSGEQIDRAVAIPIVRETIAAIDLPATPPALPVTGVESRVTPAAVDAALERAETWLSGPITLISNDGQAQVEFTVEDLAEAFRSEPAGSDVRLFFDPESVAVVLEQIRADVEAAPVNARFEIVDGTQVEVVPGRNGTEIDPQTTAANLAVAAGGSIRRGVLPLAEGAEPEVTTEQLEALGIEHLVSQFTTYHACCQNRVTNIHLIADAVDRVVVPPGGTFSLNEHVGPRTADKGYLEGGTIVAGELKETVGGGVSQFATTMYNAVFWGGYEDVTHKPHSFYFPRYPRGIEATISWPQPELSFRNDTDAAVLIDTSYTDTSVTVRLFGDNDGRIVAADWAEPGPYDFEVLAEGGDEARRVDGDVSDRINFRSPPDPLYRAVDDLDVDSTRTVQTATDGYSVIVTRTITVGSVEETQEWTVVYSPRREIIEVHPCKVPDTSVECPAPPTTEPPPSTEPTDSTTPTTTPTTTGSTAPTTTAGG